MSHISSYLCIFVEIFIYLSDFKWKHAFLWSHNSSFYVNMFNFEKQEFSVLFEFEQLEA
jgi:hypothetical protein